MVGLFRSILQMSVCLLNRSVHSALVLDVLPLCNDSGCSPYNLRPPSRRELPTENVSVCGLPLHHENRKPAGLYRLVLCPFLINPIPCGRELHETKSSPQVVGAYRC